MGGQRIVTVTLEDGTAMAVLADQVGPTLVADKDVVARLGTVTASVESVSRNLLDAVKRAAPTSATIELGFSLAIEEGQLVALFGKARGEATLTVTLEWSREQDADRT
jgi:Trypsin-co-occurring domain 1